jgi:hypothetical protein
MSTPGQTPATHSQAPLRIAPYAASIFTGAVLLFLVQPMAAKQLLPAFGGGAAVWSACLMFFQIGLLFGYAYADWSSRRFGIQAQVAIHLVLVALGATAIFTAYNAFSTTTTPSHPALAILRILTLTVGLPYFVLASTSPLLQSWYSNGGLRPFPYRLYALSNLGSLAALLGYPFLVEPALDLPAQWAVWRIVYIAFALFTAAAGYGALRSHIHEAANVATPPTDVAAQIPLWIALAACPSILLLAVTNELSQSIAPVPLLWIAPLAVYLLTFILCFDRRPLLRAPVLRYLVPAALIGLVFIKFNSGESLAIGVPISLGGLFIIALFCHGQLADRKPEGSGATIFYLSIALGGAIGGVFVGLLSPILFNDFFELPVACALALILSLYLLSGYRTLRFPVSCGVVALVFARLLSDYGNPAGDCIFKGRNFYGALEVCESGNVRQLLHGMTIHGSQSLTNGPRSPLAPAEPATYYGRQSGIGRALERGAPPQKVGAVGLGAGSIAAYGKPGDTYRFYEIDPLVEPVARTRFTFLRDSQASIQIVNGDARLSLASESDQHFDTLVLDAFSGDSIPVHLLTMEAFDLYFRHLKEDGVLAVHISNRYLDLSPLVAGLAERHRRIARLVISPGDANRGLIAAAWVLIGNNDFLQDCERRSIGHVIGGSRFVWTDQYSNILSVLF